MTGSVRSDVSNVLSAISEQLDEVRDWEAYKRPGHRQPLADDETLLQCFLENDDEGKVFEAYAVARYFVESPGALEWLLTRRDTHDATITRRLSRVCIQAGAYTDVLRFEERCASVGASVWKRPETARTRLEMQIDCAKSLRNLGDLGRAMEHYQAAGEFALENRFSVDVVRSLLLSGKLFGHYRGLKSAYSALTRLAEKEFTKLLDVVPADEKIRAKRYQAICCDSVGQTLRDVIAVDRQTQDDEEDTAPARRQFEQALRLHGEIGHRGGVVRAHGHLLMLQFRDCQRRNNSQGMVEVRDNFFRQCVRPFYARGSQVDSNQEDQLCGDELGAGIRCLQYASMCDVLGDTRDALDLIDQGLHVAYKFSHYRTVVRALRIKADIVNRKRNDQKVAVSLLRSARQICTERELMATLIDVNSDLASLFVAGERYEDLIEVLRTNSDLLATLFDEATREKFRDMVVSLKIKAWDGGHSDLQFEVNEISAHQHIDYQLLVRKLQKNFTLSIGLPESYRRQTYSRVHWNE